MKWGILATGTIAKKFASTVEQMGAEGEQLVAVGSRHLESAQAFAQQYGIPRCYDSYEALAADPEVEAIYIGTGTVHTGTRVIAACTVRSTHKLKSVIHEILAGIGCCFRCLGCRCLCCCQLFFQLLCRLDLRSRSVVLVGIFFRRNFKYSRNRSFLDDLRLCVCNHRFLPHQTA